MSVEQVDSYNGWDLDIDFPIGEREEKPRNTGLTMILDKGLGLNQTADHLDVSAPYIDLWKLSFGTSFFYPEQVLRDKIKLIKERSICVFPGGTALEVACIQGKVEAFLKRAQELGFSGVEVSDGTIEMERRDRTELIARANDMGLTVLSEVGKKEKGVPFDALEMSRQIEADTAAGAYRVIVEARESGRGVAIYDAQGNPDVGDVETLLQGVSDPNVILWEAPLKTQQIFYLKRLGNNANLGNINVDEILAVESLRRGVRGDTFKLTLEERV